MRACLGQEFDVIYIFNLRGNQRTAGELSRKEGGKFFDSGSRTPVAITLLIKCGDSVNNKDKKAQIFYYDIGDYLSRQDKLNIISNFKSIEGIEKQGLWTKIEPNKDYDWINQRDYSFLEFMPIADKKSKFKPLSQESELHIFEAISMGISTSRDSWVYNFSKESLAKNMTFMIENYNAEVEKRKLDSAYQPTMDKAKINWSRALNNDFDKGLRFDFCDSGLIVSAHYRPFTKCPRYILLRKPKR